MATATDSTPVEKGLAPVPVVPMESQAQVTSAAVDTAKKVLDTKADSASSKKAGCFSCFSGKSEVEKQTQIQLKGAPEMAVLVATTDEEPVTQAQLQSNLIEMPTADAAATVAQPAASAQLVADEAEEAPTKTQIGCA